MEQRDIDHLIQLAAHNIDHGVIEEPRIFFDVIPTLPNQQISKGDPQAFLNGEDMPIRITQLLYGFRPNYDADLGTDERLLQRVGARLVFHDQYYQSRQFLPAPLWADKVIAGPQSLSSGISSHTFDKPVILSARDSLAITIYPEFAPEAGDDFPVQVAVHGVGLQSKRPYFLASERRVTDGTPITLSTADFRNDGAEPIALSDMVIQVGAAASDPIGVGDTRWVRVGVKQLGNGTGRLWVNTPISPLTGVSTPGLPAQFWGFTQGRCVVHRFPGEGLLFEPGEGITVEVSALASDSELVGLPLGIVLSGYIALV